MTDLEDQVGATLAAAAEGAPDGVGLAAAARRRHRVRRQRRMAGGGVAAVLVLVASAVAIGTRDGDDRVAKDPTETPSSLQTISSGDARAEIPADWKRFECGTGPEVQIVYGPADGASCSSGFGVYWFGEEVADLGGGVGEVVDGQDEDGMSYSSGSVTAGSQYLVVATDDADLTRQILATARVEGQPVVDGSSPWVTFERGGITYEIPAFWGVGEKGDRSGYAVCAQSPERNAEISAGSEPSARLFRLTEATAERRVGVMAPTEALAQLVLATVTDSPDAVGDGGCVEEDFNLGLLPPESSGGGVVENSEPAAGAGEGPTTVRFEGLVFEVPAAWQEAFCNESPAWSPRPSCGDPGEGLQILSAFAAEDLGHEPLEVWSEEILGQQLWNGYVVRGDLTVLITHPDKEQVGLLLSRVRS